MNVKGRPTEEAMQHMKGLIESAEDSNSDPKLVAALKYFFEIFEVHIHKWDEADPDSRSPFRWQRETDAPSIGE